MKHFFTIAILLLASAQRQALANQVVRLLNGTMTDISVDGTSPIIEAIPGKSFEVSISKFKALRFGQEVLEYGDLAVKALSGLSVATVQAQPSGCLYLVPSSATKPVNKLPKQSTGFPICPVRRIDLT